MQIKLARLGRTYMLGRSCLVGGALLASCAVPSPDENAERPKSDAHALSGELFGINVATDTPGGAAVATLGARWARLELRDESTGPNLSESVKQSVRATIDDYHAHGVKVLVVLDYMTRGGFGGGGAMFCPVQGDWGTYRAEFVSRAADAASSLGDIVDAWQIWNEPDHPCGANPGYEPYVPPEEFGPLARATHDALRPGSGAPIVLGGLESGDLTYVDRVIAAAGPLDYVNAIAIQIYGVVPNDGWCGPGGKAEGEFLNCEWGRLDGKVHEYHQRSGGLQVWVTEVGFRTDDAHKQADYLEDAYNAFASTGDKIGHVFWFSYSDAMVAPFGLTDTSFAPKPSYFRYQSLAGAMPDGGGAGVTTGGSSEDGDGGNANPSCGDLAAQMGWGIALCEWNGNGACGGEGTPTWDCDHCCGW